MADWFFIAGLGNPGRDYLRTRHNAGFMAVDALAERWRSDWTLEKKFQARVARAVFSGQQVLLCKPQSFMNASGESVGTMAAYFGIVPVRLLVIVDDADLALGEIRLRAQGSSGGHHGLESVIQHLGTREFPRLRLGIGRHQDGRREITDYVLAQFSRDELAIWDQVLARACDQSECWLREGILKAMSLFNGKVTIES